MADRIEILDPSGRLPVTLHGGPFDGCKILAPAGSVEVGLSGEGGERHAYEIKGRWASYIGLVARGRHS